LKQNDIGDAGAESLSQALLDNGSLTILKLDYNHITDVGCVALANTLKVCFLPFDSLCDLILVIHIPISLHVTQQCVDQINGCQAQRQFLATCYSDAAHEFSADTALLDLNLTANRISDRGAIELAHALRVNSYLHTLVLSDNQIGDAGTCALAETLRTNTIVRSLNLAQNNVGDQGAAACTDMLSVNSTLRELYLCTILYL
jgi:hypothetical protein